MTRAEFTIAIPTKALPTSNGDRKANHYAQAKMAKELRTKAHWIGNGLPRVETPAQITVTIGKAHGGLWDVDNISAKALIDGIVDAGVLPDDNTRYLKRVTKEEGPRHKQKGLIVVTVVIETIGGK